MNQRTFLQQDFPLIRRAAIRFALVALAGAALAGGASTLASRHVQEKQQMQARRDQALSSLNEAELEKREIREFQPKYMRLQQRGFIGEENRLGWVEALRDIQERRKLLPVAYQIAARQALPADPAIAIGSMELRASRMTLQMKLWHDDDLFRLLQDLGDAGIHTLNKCTLVRTGQGQENPSPEGLDAECTLYWLTLGQPAAPDAPPQGAQ
ncbi:MAG TPA: hypothetical protein VIM12_13270 [Noviherbaspirillum sp.]|jgi:hypothetical protein|uniref:hypothetical protein n=1 Tax=Noviherbaspirillum sp. TaxID=1926288 RepID=UPI002F94E640